MLRTGLLFIGHPPIVPSVQAKQEQKVPKVDRIIENEHVCVLSERQYLSLGFILVAFSL